MVRNEVLMPNNASSLKLFVYGTLMPGGVGYQQFCIGRVLQAQSAIASGRLYALPAGYPAMTLGEGWVRGFMLEFRQAGVLAQLDEYEDYDPQRSPAENLYYRELLPIFTPDETPLATAWIYLMQSNQVAVLEGKYLPMGYWQGMDR
jgi:gamma-glutamylcyclotransferase (GGCT)/AIG2-like uncharacterized protein YtfP